MEKKLDLSKSVYDLVKEYPEVTDYEKLRVQRNH